MKYATALATAGALVLCTVGAANAATFQIVNGSAATIPGGAASNDVLSPLGLTDPLAGFAKGSIELIGTGQILVEYFGKEAGYRNSFLLDGGTITASANATSSASTPLASFITSSLTGLLDFTFHVDSYISEANVANGSANENIGSAPNFFASIVGNPPGVSGDAVWLFLDDGGADEDADYDDMVVRLSVAPVPLPPSILMLGTAVAGLVARRFRSGRAKAAVVAA